MAYIKSTDIQLFPSAFRGHYDTSGNVVFNPASRLTTEYNLTTLSARASRFHQSYVLDYKSETVDKTIIFNIKGYLFAVKMATFLATLTTETQIWAKIKLVDIASNDTDNTVDTNPVLRPVEGTGTLLDEGTVEGNFLGLSLETANPTSALAPGEHTLLILEKTGGVWDVPAKSYFRMSAKEISDSVDETKSIDEEFNTEDLTVTKINKITITPPSSTSTLTIENGKTLTVKDSVTLAGTGTATFNKNLTVAGDYNITLETAGADRILKVSGSNKELAGAGSVLTMGGNLTTLGAHTTTFTTTDDTTITLPKTGTLATIAGTENLTNKTLTSPTLITPTLGVATATKINGLTIDTTTGGTLDIADSKTLAVNESITLNADQARTLTINGSNKTLAGSGTTLTLRNNFTTGTHVITLNTTGTTNITLPTTGTLATIAGAENLTNKTVNGLTFESNSTGFDISGGTTYKTFSVSDNVYIDASVGIFDSVNIQAPLYVDATTDISVPFTVGGTTSGGVKIQSGGTSLTTITGPNGGEAKLIAGTYGNAVLSSTTSTISSTSTASEVPTALAVYNATSIKTSGLVNDIVTIVDWFNDPKTIHVKAIVDTESSQSSMQLLAVSALEYEGIPVYSIRYFTSNGDIQTETTYGNPLSIYQWKRTYLTN